MERKMYRRSFAGRIIKQLAGNRERKPRIVLIKIIMNPCSDIISTETGENASRLEQLLTRASVQRMYLNN